MSCNIFLSAKEARKIADSTSFVSNNIYRFIKDEANSGNVFFRFYYDFISRVTLDSVIDKLRKDGYKVSDPVEELDEETGYMHGYIDIEW